MDIKKEKILNHKELIDSGLLYEINRSLFHTIGLELTVFDDESLCIVDHRDYGVKYEKLDKKKARQGEEFIVKQQEIRFEKVGFITQI